MSPKTGGDPVDIFIERSSVVTMDCACCDAAFVEEAKTARRIIPYIIPFVVRGEKPNADG
jgi:hypothetical protein